MSNVESSSCITRTTTIQAYRVCKYIKKIRLKFDYKCKLIHIYLINFNVMSPQRIEGSLKRLSSLELKLL